MGVTGWTLGFLVNDTGVRGVPNELKSLSILNEQLEEYSPRELLLEDIVSADKELALDKVGEVNSDPM